MVRSRYRRFLILSSNSDEWLELRSRAHLAVLRCPFDTRAVWDADLILPIGSLSDVTFCWPILNISSEYWRIGKNILRCCDSFRFSVSYAVEVKCRSWLLLTVGNRDHNPSPRPRATLLFSLSLRNHLFLVQLVSCTSSPCLCRDTTRVQM